MSKSFEQLKKQLNQFKEEKEMQDIITNLDTRKAAIKEQQKEEMRLHKKLTASVKKAGKQMPGSLDFAVDSQHLPIFFFKLNNKAAVFLVDAAKDAGFAVVLRCLH